MKSLIFLVLALMGCSTDETNLKIAATPVPHAHILEFVKPELEEHGINLKIVIMDDYNMPNRALADKEVDANFFQHRPFLEMQVDAFNYPIQILTPVEIEPMGLYSKKITRLSELKENSIVAIPNDPSNEGRALLILQKEGIITLDTSNEVYSTLFNISNNPKNLRFIEMDASMIPRTLADVDLAAINTNFALEAGLNPLTDALAIEAPNSPYANVLVIRKGDENRPDLLALKRALTSEKMKKFLNEEYNGAILPAW